MNNKFLVLVLVICTLFLTGLVAKEGRLISLAIPFLLYMIIGVIQYPKEVDLKAERAIKDPIVNPQEIVEMQIRVENHGKTISNLALKDEIFPSMETFEGHWQQRLTLPAGETTQFSYRFRAARGVYSWRTIQAYAGDPFGLFNTQSEISAPGELRVCPTPLMLQPVTIKPRITLHAAGTVPSRLAGTGIDFWGIREFRQGDSLRRLNRRLAARHPRKIFSNVYEKEEIVDYGLILDARKLYNANGVEEGLFEYSVSAAMSLSENFLNSGNRVSLLIFGESITTVFPGYGKRQLNKIRWNLARASLGDHYPFNYLDYFPTRLFPSRSVVVILSTVHPRDFEIYASLIANGYDVLLISPDPIEYAARMLPGSLQNSLAARAARVERVTLLRKLLKLRVNVIDWQVNQPLGPILQDTALSMLKRRNY